MNKCNIMGVDIVVTNMNEVVKYIEDNINEIKGKYICISNVHTTVMAYENENYREIQNNAILALPDGGPLATISRKRGFLNAERVTGPALMGEIFKISERVGYTHYFYGSSKDTLKELQLKLKDKYPKLKINGMYSPAFKDNIEVEDKAILNDMKNSDFLWVGLGAPKQEIWMKLHEDKIDSLMIGVGAGFDYYAEKIKRAPEWMQRNNLEWFFRLIQEPKRLFKRYFKTNIKFIKNAFFLHR